MILVESIASSLAEKWGLPPLYGDSPVRPVRRVQAVLYAASAQSSGSDRHGESESDSPGCWDSLFGGRGGDGDKGGDWVDWDKSSGI